VLGEGLVQFRSMADEEKGARWWFRYVLVPLIGSGGLVAIIVALMSRQPPPVITTSTISPASQRQLAFTVKFGGPGTEFEADSSSAVYDINLYVDDVLAGRFKVQGKNFHQDVKVHISQVGNHKYSLTGTFRVTHPYTDLYDRQVSGQGEIYVQDGGEFSLEHDPKGPDDRSWLLRRIR